MINYTAYARAMAAGVNTDAIAINQVHRQHRQAQRVSEEAQDILALFTIARDEANTFFDTNRDPVQLAWRVTRTAIPTERCSIVFDGADWTVCDMQRLSYSIPAYIQAVKSYVAMKRLAREAQA